MRPADPESRFVWQNTAADALAEAREAYPTSGALVFNMAGTGQRQDTHDVRAACVLSRSVTPRFSIALNLRSLTLQTGPALQCQLGLSDSDLATVIGDDVTRKLFNASNIKEKENIAAPWSDDDGNPAEPGSADLRRKLAIARMAGILLPQAAGAAHRWRSSAGFHHRLPDRRRRTTSGKGITSKPCCAS